MSETSSTGTSWSHRMAAWLYAHRTAALAVCLALAAGAVWPAKKVRVDNAVQRWFAEDSPALATYHDFQHDFGNDEIVVVALTPEGGLFTPKGLRALRRATTAARRVEGVASVTSLATLPLLADSLAGDLSKAKARRLQRRVQADSTLPPLLVEKSTRASGTSPAAGLLVRMEPHAEIDGHRGRILSALDRALQTAGNAEIAAAGTGVIHVALERATMEGSALLIVVANGLVFVLLWFIFGRIGPVLVTMSAVVVATLWLLGVYGLFGGALNTVTMVMPTLVLVITTADCVHLLLQAARATGETPRERAVQTVGRLLRPCAFTTLTTAAGFLALATSSMPVVRELGLFSAVGLTGGLVASVVACTAALAHDRAVPKQRDGLNRWAGRLAAAGLRWRKVVLVGTALLAAGAGVGIAQLRVDTDSLGYLYEDHPARQESRRVENLLGPYMPMEFVVRVPAGDALQPELIRAVRRWEQAATRSGLAGWAWSATGVLRRLHAHLPNGRATLPRKEDRMDALLEVARTKADSTLKHLTAKSGDSADGVLRVTFGVPAQSARGFQQAARRLHDAADLPADAVAEASGYLPLYVHMMQQMVRSQIFSFLAALVVITAMIGVLFRSVWTALLSLVPNLLPIALTLGLMGAAGLPLDAATVTIAAVVLGLIVDDTVHLFHRHFDAEAPHATSVPRQVARAGAPLVATTFVLAGGFTVLLLAPIKSVVWFGLLIGTATLLALTADLVVTPVLMAARARGGLPAQERDRDAP